MKTSIFDHWKFTPDIVKLWNLKSGRIFKWKTNAKFTKAHYWQISFQSSWFSAIFSPVINLYPSTQVFVFVIVCVCLLRFSTMKMIHIAKQQYKYHSVHSKWPQKDLDEEQKPFHGSSWICFGFKTNQELPQKGFPRWM